MFLGSLKFGSWSLMPPPQLTSWCPLYGRIWPDSSPCKSASRMAASACACRRLVTIQRYTGFTIRQNYRCAQRYKLVYKFLSIWLWKMFCFYAVNLPSYIWKTNTKQCGKTFDLLFLCPLHYECPHFLKNYTIVTCLLLFFFALLQQILKFHIEIRFGFVALSTGNM